MTTRITHQLGFTLIELLVVVLIIGILASVALPQYQNAVEKARAVEAWSVLRTIDTAQKIKNMEEGTSNVSYPLDELAISLVDKDGSTVSGDHFFSPYFYYVHTSDGIFVATKSGTTGGSYWSYWLYLENGKRVCASPNAIGQQKCKKLVGSNGKNGTCLSGTCFTE